MLGKLIETYQPGENVFVENEPGDEMFFVFEGQVDLLKSGRLLKRVGLGEYFGEMSMLINTPRTATATVVGDNTKLIAVKTSNFEAIMRENPDIVLALLKEMAERLKTTNLALTSSAAPVGWKKDA